MEWLQKINMQEKKTDRKKRHNGAFLFSRNLLAPKYPGPYRFFDGQKAFLFQRKNLVLFFWCDDIPLKNCCEPGFYLLSLSPFGIFFGCSWKETVYFPLESDRRLCEMLFKLSFITICLFDLHQCRQGESIGFGLHQSPGHIYSKIWSVCLRCAALDRSAIFLV